ncbi:MAG: SDR family NAD(P)-dependent oxidoreductase [Candidatus Binataceae bacterium]|jgi:NAD(P)-dependent dehydrogenase (short-subunit alcohol dehydrogenase family)
MATIEELKGKTAVVTGGASGIGKALAARCCAAGMNVVLGDVELKVLEATRDELAQGKANVIGVVTDVSRPEEIERLAAKTLDAFGSADLLFNNAGVGAGTTVWESTLEDWTWVIGVNLWGVIHGIRTFVPIMLKQNRPAHIINTASIAGLVRGHHSAAYATTKHAVVALTEQLALEFERTHAPIKASVLCPSWVNTRINEAGRNRPKNLQNKTAAPPPTPEMIKTWERMQKFIQQATSPAEIADSVFEEGIRQEKLYIIPHKETAQYIKNRFDGIIKDV